VIPLGPAGRDSLAMAIDAGHSLAVSASAIQRWLATIAGGEPSIDPTDGQEIASHLNRLFGTAEKSALARRYGIIDLP